MSTLSFTVYEPAGMLDMSSSPLVVPARDCKLVFPVPVHLSLYIHGTAEDEAGFDIPALVSGEFVVQECFDVPVNLELPGRILDCRMFIWHTGELKGLLDGKLKRWLSGCIVAADDAKNIKWAKAAHARCVML